MDRSRAGAPTGTRVTCEVLEERSAGEDVDRLEAAADPEDGQASRVGGSPGGGLQLVPLRLDVDGAQVRGAVTGRIDVGSAGQEEALHRAEGGRTLRWIGGAVDDDRQATVTLDGVRVETVLAGLQVGIRVAPWNGHRDDDAGERTLAHEARIAP